MTTEIGSSKTIYKYVIVWWNNNKMRVYPSGSLGHAMQDAKAIITSEAFSYYHELGVYPFDLLEEGGECKNFLGREDIMKWYKEARPWYKDQGTYTPPKDQRRDQRGLSPHPYPPFVPRLIQNEEFRLPFHLEPETPVVQKIVDDHEKRRESIEKFLNYGYETWHVKVSREDEPEEKRAGG